MKCPICKKKEVVLGDPDFPFCSERCRVIDLANWATDRYVIPGQAQKPSKPDEDE